MIKFFKSRGFTDRLYIINFIMVWLFVWGCFIASLFSGKLEATDLSSWSTAISCSFAELGLHTSFIIWKSKCENLHKFGRLEDTNINVE